MELRETSGNFEIEELQLFLKRAELLIGSGFAEDEILQVQRAVESMQIDATTELEHPIEVKDIRTTLRITIFMDEAEFPEVTFLTHPDLAETIDRQMIRFFEEMAG